LRAGGNRTGGDRPPGTDVDTCESLLPIWRAGDQANAEQLVDLAGTISTNKGSHGGIVAHVPTVAGTVVARSSRGGGQTNSPGHNADEQLVAHALRADGFDASEDGTGRGTPLVPCVGFQSNIGSHGGDVHTECSPTLRVQKTGGGGMPAVAVPVAFAENSRAEDGTGRGTPLVPVPIDLRCTSRGEKMTNNRSPDAQSGGPAGTGIGKPGDPAFTVSERQQAVALPVELRVCNPAGDWLCPYCGEEGSEGLWPWCEWCDKDATKHPQVRGAVGTDCFNGDITGEVAATLGTRGSSQNASGPTVMTLAIRGRDGEPSLEVREDGTANAILTPNGGRAGIGVGAVAIQERAVCENPDAGPDGVGVKQDGTAYTLEARTVPQAVAFAQNQRDEVRLMDAAGALAAEPGANQQTYLHTGMAVRRLTPVECCRLQGFPDDYLTQVTWRGKSPPPDGPMYKALGNSMACNVMRWLGQRIAMVAEITADESEVA
jgi:hypothetical protein